MELILIVLFPLHVVHVIVFRATLLSRANFFSFTSTHCEEVIPNNSYDWTNPLYVHVMVEARAFDDDDYGKIWVDDSVGALLQALDDAGVKENTIFLFEEDHWMDSKGALYEGGIWIPQFVHYPKESRRIRNFLDWICWTTPVSPHLIILTENRGSIEGREGILTNAIFLYIKSNSN